MSKNRIKQRNNRQKSRYLKALDSHRAADWSDSGDCWRIARTDACGRKDLTGYNAVKLLENRDWTIVYK